MRYGLIGNPLGHSWSPKIHALLGDYEYGLYPLEKEELASFLGQKDLGGLNVTLPYKKEVLPFCSGLSDAAQKIGCVNVLRFTPEGIFGDNTDCDGFLYMVRRSGIAFEGRKVLVLGSGGASLTARYCSSLLGAGQIVTISRKGPDDYDHLDRHRDAQIIINTTPLGMYPDNESQALSLAEFPKLEGVLDVVYNPLRTAIIQQAQEMGILCSAGLPMLVAQAVAASERFMGNRIPDEKTEQVLSAIRSDIENIVLIGMPGCGKSTIGLELEKMTGRKLVDLDNMIEEENGCSIPEIITTKGEEFFRDLETEAVCRWAKQSGLIIACGGGTPLRERNRRLLRQNGMVFWLQRELSLLPTEGRPLSVDLEKLESMRRPVYEAASDAQIDNNGPAQETAKRILEVFGK